MSSRYGRSSDDLAYGDYNRWDRDRFDRFGRPPPQPPAPPRRFEEDFRFVERDSPGRRDVLIDDRTESRGPRGYDERERIFRETYGGRRRTDRELFGNVDPRDIADMAVQPYRGDSREKDLEITIKEKKGARPGMLRRQSSLDTFDRRPIPRYDREDRLPANVPIPLPVRRRDEEYREVEVKRERSVHRRRGGRDRSVSSTSSSSISTVVEKARAGFKKGKTRMPRRLVVKEAILDLGYPFIEEDRFFVLQIALEKEQIDEVIKISETYKASGKHDVFRYEERSEASPERPSRDRVTREVITKEEIINPPSDFLRAEAPRRSRSHLRAHSPSIESSISQRTSRSRARSTVLPGPDYFEERKTVIEESGPSSGALVVQRSEMRSDMDIQAEIIRLEAERKALRLERGEDMQMALIREERPRSRSRDRSPPRNVIRVEKDRKERRRARLAAAAMATLT